MENQERKGPKIEITATSIIVGLIIGVVMTAANVYLGLYAGLTVSASIPAAVLAMAVFKTLSSKNSVLQSNIVQTMASAGESLAAGIIFTVPALVLVGAWNNFEFWPTTIIAVSGGLLGVVFMVPLRKALIVENKELTYPEGVACSAVLKAGSAEKGSAGSKLIFLGLLIGGVFKFLSGGLHFLRGSVEIATRAIGNRVMFLGSDISPALLAVGYIVKLEVAILIFMGGALGWFIAIPALSGTSPLSSGSALDQAWTLWSTQIRYIGVGAMIVGGVFSIFSVRKGIQSGLKALGQNYKSKGSETKQVDLGTLPLGIIFAVSLACMFGLYQSLIGSMGFTFFVVAIMVVASFLFVAVSSYVVGLVGSSNNPVSGMTISALLGTAILFLIFGFEGESAILTTLGVAAVVCCAACTSGDCSQDLKTGTIVGATPRSQQIAQVLGVIIPALVIAPVLTLLHSAYGIGSGLKAPQATLFANITKGIFGGGDLPYDMVWIGVALGVGTILIDTVLQKNGSKFRLHLMPMAVGIYLPVTLSVPILIGGVIRYCVDSTFKKANKANEEGDDKGILLSSGLIAGEAIMGVIIALFLYFKVDLKWGPLSASWAEILSVLALFGLAYYLYRLARFKRSA